MRMRIDIPNGDSIYVSGPIVDVEETSKTGTLVVTAEDLDGTAISMVMLTRGQWLMVALEEPMEAPIVAALRAKIAREEMQQRSAYRMRGAQ